mmetsp:Transcript_6093/g.8603  ORF Transcript_6093/g.8603 Transcript_6093/m.8603 type:complete len:169 (-) Transcript_6093:201-707(-)
MHDGRTTTTTIVFLIFFISKMKTVTLVMLLGSAIAFQTQLRPSCLSSAPQIYKKNVQRSYNRNIPITHAVIPGDTAAEAIVLVGTLNFLSIYNALITARILLSWFPQSMGVPFLQPIFIVTDPFLNLFRGLIPPIFGLDLSLIPALLLLQAAGNSVAALGADMTMLTP